ncbi:AAA family ATPase [Lysinibacillus capsici]|jgi:predicted ATP-binding protein involved in virulence|uniref:AAA family ATPase n=1 Tax=Lysinibacillus capsici TaxID=2115968 RepID=UPI003D728034
MELKFINIWDYKVIKEKLIFLVPEGGYPPYYKDYFNNNYTILVGENGQGKTTLLSFIINIFHNLERFHSRIFADFVLRYDLFLNKTEYRVLLEKYDDEIYITIKDVIRRSLLLENNPKKTSGVNPPKNNYSPIITYKEIRKFLPAKIIGSVFSFHGEYPSERPASYVGEERVKVFDIAKLYGLNHYNFNSLSNGISKIIEMYKEDSKSVNQFFELLNLTFENKVRIFELNYDESLSEFDYLDDEGWIKVTELNRELIISKHSKGALYLNDLSFIKNGTQVNLSNMSSGEKMFLVRILSILSEIEDNSIVIIEEPELHLNPSWTKQIISMFHHFFKKYNVHFLISTHDYSFINTLFPENIIQVKDGEFKHLNPEVKTFLANEAEINNIFFDNTQKANYVEEVLYEKISKSTKEELEEIFGYLGESYIKFKVFNEMLRKNDVESDQ